MHMYNINIDEFDKMLINFCTDSQLHEICTYVSYTIYTNVLQKSSNKIRVSRKLIQKLCDSVMTMLVLFL